MSDDQIRSLVPRPAMLEHLAEECAELAHAALKQARILRGENPAGGTLEDAVRSTIEEYSDLLNVADVLGLVADGVTRRAKMERWENRLMDGDK